MTANRVANSLGNTLNFRKTVDENFLYSQGAMFRRDKGKYGIGAQASSTYAAYLA
jgi:hypothetical protein